MSKNKMTLVRWLIEKTNTDRYRAGLLKGWKHPDVDQKLIDEIGQQELIRQAKELEADKELMKTGMLKFDWRYVGGDLEKISYNISLIPLLCERENILDARENQKIQIAKVKKWKEQSNREKWILQYYDDMLGRLKAGKCVREASDELNFKCLNAIAAQNEFIWERVFSANVLGDSKAFRKKGYRNHLYSVLKRYSPYYADDMEIKEEEQPEKCKDELFAMHNVHSFEQYMEWKGNLKYLTDHTNMVDTAAFPYGFVMNAQSLEHSVPIELSNCKMIMTIENKANYESMSYDRNALYIYCHGYFTPKEVKFLKEIYQLTGEGCKIYHWGDMDYGGISIFQDIKARIFPTVEPYKMDKGTFYKALEEGAGMPLKASTRERLLKKEAGMLEELKEAILETDKVVEQEQLL